MSKRHRGDEPPDPAGEYRDWIDHRYTPGYFTGGRLPPWIKRLQDGGGGGRMLGAVLIGTSLLSLLTLAVLARRSRLADMSGVLPGVVYALASLVAGIMALRRARRAGTHRTSRRRPH